MLQASGLERARAALERSGRFPAGALPEAIAQSWSRCVARGLDPLDDPRGAVVPFDDVRARREKAGLLRRLALAELQLLHAQIAGSDFMIAFADADGVVLDTISDHRFAESAAGRSIVPGSVWREEERGTNALGLAIRDAAPIAIYGREHFFAAHGHLSCLAVPVFDPAGEVAGILDASCSNEARQQHTHALLRMAATEIENGLILQDRSSPLVLAFHPRPDYLDTLSAGLLVLDAEGRLRSLNRPGRALLSGLPAGAGTAFEALFDAGFAATMDGLRHGGPVRVRDRAGSAVFLAGRRIGGGAARAALPAAAVPAESGFVCGDAALQRGMRDLPAAVRRRMAVLITGETGTGKELMARHVHAVSGRGGAFVAVNCGAVPEQLFIAELFGHERGAYTNARNEGSPGLIGLADKGTLFLDEVADIPLPAQAALLRFLDDMEIRPVGGQKTRRVDVQVVSATNADLEQAVAARRFRRDLLYRLDAFAIALPPLRERSDFAALVHHLLARDGARLAITDDVMERLRGRSWPGNIRELGAHLRRAAIAADGDLLDDGAAEAEDDDACARCAGRPLDAMRCRRIRQAYAAEGGNVTAAARRLGLSRTTLYKHVGP